jgi:nucleoid-associated protein YgaU
MKRVFAFVGLTTLLLWGLGCSGSKGLKVNVSAGEYYSEDEYEELSKAQKEAYCDALAKELALLKKTARDKESELKATEEHAEKLKKELGPIESQLLKLDSDIRTLKTQIAELEALPKQWTIRPGECLWTIAGYDSIYSDPVKWPRIFRANMDKIEDPDYIYPDTVLVIPRDWPTSHIVAENECLWLIAGYWEIYDSPLEWTKIFEANKDQIKDPDLIVPQQVLTIPR